MVPGATPSTATGEGWGPLLDGLPHAAWVVALADSRVAAANVAAAAFLGRPIRETADDSTAPPDSWGPCGTESAL